jgi:isopenicillin N synthase-like dioxygenase
MEAQGIPVIHMEGFGQGDQTHDNQIALAIIQALQDIGFFSVTGHVVPDDLVAQAFVAMEKVFVTVMTEQQRLAYEFTADGHQWGYTPPGGEISVGAIKRNLMAFWHCNDPDGGVHNVFPQEVPEFGQTMLALIAALKQSSEMIFQAIALGMGRDRDFFGRWIKHGRNLLRPIHYPALNGNEQVERSGAHEDIDLGTLMVPATVPGLQVKTRQGVWVDAINPPGALIFNAGDMLQLHTHGVIKSTTHQVVHPQQACPDRFSIPFFIHPSAETVLMTADAMLKHRLREIGLLAKLPGHQLDY